MKTENIMIKSKKCKRKKKMEKHHSCKRKIISRCGMKQKEGETVISNETF